jgi:replicative DNA helicase
MVTRKGLIQMEYRIPPSANEAEISVLGSMIIDSNIITDITEILSSEDFYDLQHKEIFKTIIGLHNKNSTIDVISISEKLKEQKLLDLVGGFEYIVSLTDMFVTSANAVTHANIIHEKSQRRMMILAANRIMDMAFDHEDIEVILDKAEKGIFGINQKNSESYSSLGDTFVSTLNQLEMRCKNRGQISGLSTGFAGIDFKLGGLQNNDLIIIAARPSMGKTSLAVDIATNVSCIKQIPTAFFSLEMSKEKIANRILSGWNLIDNQKIRLGTIEDTDWQKIGKSLGPLSESKLIIDDTPNIKASEIRARCRRIKNKMGGLGLIVVDHLTEMWRPHRGNDTAEHEENVRCMKRLAKEMNCPVILLQQLNRGVETRSDKHPMLSDLKETGAAEEVADVVMMIYRDDYYNPDSDKKNIAEIIVAKGRDVGTGTVELAWLGEYTKFANIEKFSGRS